MYTQVVMKNIFNSLLTARSPEIFAPASMPVAAGKKIANTEKKVSSCRKSGPKFSMNISAAGEDLSLSVLTWKLKY